jgi:hypothetical protein
MYDFQIAVALKSIKHHTDTDTDTGTTRATTRGLREAHGLIQGAHQAALCCLLEQEEHLLLLWWL